MAELKQQICSKTVFDTTIPGIKFDENGVANYCQIYEEMLKNYYGDDPDQKKWLSLVQEIKIKEKNKKYDCIVGLSGGTDSSYLLHMAKKSGLNPLAVYVDNGWSTETSLNNIKTMTSALAVDLETIVLDYEMIKDLLLSYMKAGMPWVDFPTDFAIQASMFRTAKREKIRTIFIGYDFKSEGKQPTEWTYGDYKQLKSIQKRFGNLTLKNYPYFTFYHLMYWSLVKKIKMIRPFHYIQYNKEEAKEFLKATYNWVDYGGHHHENGFTKFAIATWLPNKFNVDKRKITLSAQILSGQISRDDALKELSLPACSAAQQKEQIQYVIKKLGINQATFDEIWQKKNHGFKDYPSYYPFIAFAYRLLVPIFKWIFPFKPALFYEMEMRKKQL